MGQLLDSLIISRIFDPVQVDLDRWWIHFVFNLAWIWILLGLLAGAITGMFFHEEEWLGGYHSWRRRMIRLAHISFLGTALLDWVYLFSSLMRHFWSMGNLPSDFAPYYVSILFATGTITMPLICYLSAWKKFCRNLFFLPVLSLILAVAGYIWNGGLL